MDDLIEVEVPPGVKNLLAVPGTETLDVQSIMKVSTRTTTNTSVKQCLKHGPNEPWCAFPLQTVNIHISWLLKKPTDLGLHCLSFSV